MGQKKTRRKKTTEEPRHVGERLIAELDERIDSLPDLDDPDVDLRSIDMEAQRRMDTLERMAERFQLWHELIREHDRGE